MSPSPVIDVSGAEDSRDVVHRAVQALAEGKLVAFPTETVYGLAANARLEEAVDRLALVKGRASKQPFTLAVKSADDAIDYVPDMSPLARRLARRCWPGPVTLVLDGGHEDGLLQQLSPGVRQRVAPNGTVGLRVPAHPLILDVMRMLAGPLVLTSANQAGEADSVNAEEVVNALNGQVQLIFDDGPSHYGQPSSVVRIDGGQFHLLREGVVNQETLQRLSSFMVLLVCTGNTCRSPMAEVICRKLLADRLGCLAEEVESRGVLVTSAGISAAHGGPPSAEAAAVMQEQGLELKDHLSQPLTDQLVQHADVILAMTAGHRDAVLRRWPQASGRIHLLSADRRDVSDPIGGPMEIYRRCSEQIQTELEDRVKDFDILGKV